ncbi:MAG: hypothetical protein IH842_01450 [Thaumarchaeota archaeon]|nr:hypothetical protein [Nitrososphaerota archaeon]
MQAEIDAINMLIKDMQDELKNIHVPWVNVTGIPTGFADNIDNDTLSQISFCTTNQIVKWNGTHWVCADIGASIAPNVLLLHYAQSTPVTLIPEEFVILAEWKIEKADSDPAFAHELIVYDLSVYANIDKNVNIGWYKSEVGGPLRADWKFHDGIIAVHSDFAVRQRSDNQNSIISKYNYIAFAIENPPGETDGVVKDFSGTVTIHLPGSESLVKLP